MSIINPRASPCTKYPWTPRVRTAPHPILQLVPDKSRLRLSTNPSMMGVHAAGAFFDVPSSAFHLRIPYTKNRMRTPPVSGLALTQTMPTALYACPATPYESRLQTFVEGRHPSFYEHLPGAMRTWLVSTMNHHWPYLHVQPNAIHVGAPIQQ